MASGPEPDPTQLPDLSPSQLPEPSPTQQTEFARPALPVSVTRTRGKGKAAAAAAIPLEAETENQRQHSPHCHYFMWNVNHRESLLTDDVVETNLVRYYSSKMGGRKPKDWDKEAEIAKIKEEMRKTVSSGLIREYLDGGKKVYDEFNDNIKQFCICPPSPPIP